MCTQLRKQAGRLEVRRILWHSIVHVRRRVQYTPTLQKFAKADFERIFELHLSALMQTA
jgi:hypothetical protein